jgi:hypothetical protein
VGVSTGEIGADVADSSRQPATGGDLLKQDDARSRYARLSDRALLGAIRSHDGEAVEEFIRRYQALVLLQARRLRIAAEDRKHWAVEVLYQVASTIARDPTTTPRSLAPYLIVACRRKAVSEWRDRLTRERSEQKCADDIGALNERAVVGVCSEHAVRATYGPGWEFVHLPPVLERLVSLLEDSVSDEEQQLLSWVGQRVPYSLVAEWLGVSRNAAVKRVARLRGRLTKAAIQFGASLDAAEFSELLRFLRRAGVIGELRLLETHNQIQEGEDHDDRP